jgi:hypothetical protein
VRKLFIILLLAFGSHFAYSQYYYVVVPPPLVKAIVPEHGFLPGKEFKFYPTIKKYNFAGLKVRAEIYDQRADLQIKKLDCSDVDITNQSEYWGESGVSKVRDYVQFLCSQSDITLDSAASDTLKIYLEVLDTRLIGVGSVTVHGLCKMTIKIKDFSKSYCIDITDKSLHSPISKNALVTRKTATRVIQSASIREVLELFFEDIQDLKMNRN